MEKFSNFINGKFLDSESGKYFFSTNPTTGEVWAKFTESTAIDVDLAVKSAKNAIKGKWGDISASQRGRLLMLWGDEIEKNAENIAKLETIQNGKLFAEMFAQAKVVKDWLYYYGGLSDKIEGSVIPLDRKSILNYTLKEPLGVVGVIVPWNSPTFLTIMSVAPALAAGNTVVIKPSEVTSASALELARLAEIAGIPPGVINVICGQRDSGEALVDHPDVAKIAFTGSEGGGKAIAARAGSRLASCTLELGGKSPNILLEDANIQNAIAGVLSGIFAAAGQTCVAGSRVYIHEKIYDKVINELTRRVSIIKLGDPLLKETQMGPVATENQLNKNIYMVEKAVSEGAKILIGGKKAKVENFEKGLFFEPTILHEMEDNNFILKEEVFGPVLSVIKFSSDDEVILKANNTRFGLAAGVWTNNIKKAHMFAKRLEAGTVWINTYRAMAFNSPFGGYKNSGIGRVNGIEAVSNFLQTKSVWCELSDEVQDPFILKV